MLVVDTGPLVATADRADKHHQLCRDLLEGDVGPLVTTPLVVAEAAYLIDRQLGPAAEAALYAAILEGALRVEDLAPGDWRRGGPRRAVRRAPDLAVLTPLSWRSPNAWALGEWPL